MNQPLPDVPAFVQSWVRQLLDPDLLSMLRDVGERQVEVRLVANRGRVRRRPAVLLDAGSQEMLDPAEVA